MRTCIRRQAPRTWPSASRRSRACPQHTLAERTSGGWTAALQCTQHPLLCPPATQPHPCTTVVRCAALRNLPLLLHLGAALTTPNAPTPISTTTTATTTTTHSSIAGAHHDSHESAIGHLVKRWPALHLRNPTQRTSAHTNGKRMQRSGRTHLADTAAADDAPANGDGQCCVSWELHRARSSYLLRGIQSCKTQQPRPAVSEMLANLVRAIKDE